MSQTILVTGGAGFIGANFIPYFMAQHPDYKIINLDKLTYAGNLANLKEVSNNPNYTFIKGDICDETLVNNLFDEYHLTGVIHFAAESHVDNSIKGPRAFMQTNFMGTFNLLEAARTHWLEAPFIIKEGCQKNRFHHISTDEVFGTLGNSGYFSETTPYAPNSPYSASKAGIIGFSKTVAQELGSRSIRCNAIAPGFIASEMTDKVPEEIRKSWMTRIALRKMGTPTDVANVAVFLASDLSSYITGQVIVCDGGMN